MNRKRLALFVGSMLVAAVATFAFAMRSEAPLSTTLMQRVRGQHTVGDRMAQFGPAARARWQPFFSSAGVSYPPSEIVMLGLKREKRLEIYARNGEQWTLIRALPVLKDSGKLGPKLRRGDYQVPEGFYPLESLNPNSAFHVSLRVGYPSAEDRRVAQSEGRGDSNLGSDIMIHGGAASIGCLAMGDEAAEDLFVLASDAGLSNVHIVLSPLDFRVAQLPANARRPAWLKARYAQIEEFVTALPAHR